ncbi:MAG: hypothetical protein AAGA20_11865 [Planctomycetota bacterium]
MVTDHERRKDPHHFEPLLDRTHRALVATRRPSERTQVVSDLMGALSEIRATSPPHVWTTLARHAVDHPVGRAVHEDPLTRRCFERPCGRLGDPAVVEALCRCSGLEPTTEIGVAVHRAVLERPLALALRQRCEWLGVEIDDAVDRAAAEGRRARILAIGSRHLHEARVSSALRSGAVDDFVAVECDDERASAVRRLSLPHVRTLELPPRSLLCGRTWSWREQLGSFDLVYVPDAYVELEAACARRLTRRLFNLLRPGGRLAFFDFLRSVPDAAYMESFMGWPCEGRDLATLADLSVRIRDDEVDRRRVFRGPYDTLGYGVVDRRRA